MKELILHPTDICQWHALINQAQVAAHLHLSENTESYLVFPLQRFAQETRLLDSVLALDFLEALPNRQKTEQLRDVGDRSLLLCGLFPGLADRRRVSLQYYSSMGQTAYLAVSERTNQASADLFFQLATQFSELQKTLESIRGEYYQFDHESKGALWVDIAPRAH